MEQWRGIGRFYPVQENLQIKWVVSLTKLEVPRNARRTNKPRRINKIRGSSSGRGRCNQGLTDARARCSQRSHISL